jgi:hypothetical protein
LAPDTRPINPKRPELIYQRYLAEKQAWLAAHPAVRPSGYRKARGFKSYNTAYCRRRAKELPLQRLDLETETLSSLDDTPNWTTEEVQAWLDYEEVLQEEADKVEEAELVAAGGYGRVRGGYRSVWSRVERDIQAEKEQYRFT